jgi:hypothetical protein
MPITVLQLQQLMEEVEQTDPIDFADLPFNEKELRSLIASQVCEMAAKLESFTEEDKRLTLLAVTAKLVLENFVLQVRLLNKNNVPVNPDVEALLRELRNKK